LQRPPQLDRLGVLAAAVLEQRGEVDHQPRQHGQPYSYLHEIATS
jgi:hypothetical protein